MSVINVLRRMVWGGGVVLGAWALPASAAEDALAMSGTFELLPAQLVQLMVERNAAALSAALQAEVSENLREGEAALYEPVVFTLARYDEVQLPRPPDDPLTSPVFGQQAEIDEQFATVEVGARQLLYTGGEAKVSYQYRGREALALNDLTEYTNVLTVSLRQPLLKGRGRSATEADLRVVELERDIDVARYRERLLEVSGDGMSAYWQLYRATEGRAIRERSLATVEDVREDVQRRVRGGFAPSTDLLESRIAVASRRADLIRSQALVDEAQASLATLLNVEAGVGVRFLPRKGPRESLEEELDFQARYARALETWPDYRIALLRARQEEVRLAFARNQRMPTLDLSVGTNWNTQDFDNRVPFSLHENRDVNASNGWFAGLEFEVPVGNSQARSQFQAQAHRLQQAQLEVGSVRNALGHDIRARGDQLQGAFAEMRQLQEDVELRAELLEAERSAYGLGRARLTDVLDREEQLNESRQRLVDSLTRLELARLALRIADGSLLDVYAVRLDLGADPEP